MVQLFFPSRLFSKALYCVTQFTIKYSEKRDCAELQSNGRGLTEGTLCTEIKIFETNILLYSNLSIFKKMVKLLLESVLETRLDT